MKQPPGDIKLEEVLRSSKLVAGGFMGDDLRSVREVIDADAAALSGTGFTRQQLAARMAEITAAATEQLGRWTVVDDNIEAVADEARGRLVCPWPHAGRFAKRVTTVRSISTGRTSKWSDLSIHLIAEHGFFGGRGSAFRNQPQELARAIMSETE